MGVQSLFDDIKKGLNHSICLFEKLFSFRVKIMIGLELKMDKP